MAYDILIVDDEPDIRLLIDGNPRKLSIVAVSEVAADGKLEPEALNDTDRLELYVWANERHRHAVLVARLDNLGKGASGAAVQNLRLMLDLDRGPK